MDESIESVTPAKIKLVNSSSMAFFPKYTYKSNDTNSFEALPKLKKCNKVEILAKYIRESKNKLNLNEQLIIFQTLNNNLSANLYDLKFSELMKSIDINLLFIFNLSYKKLYNTVMHHENNKRHQIKHCDLK